MAGPDGFRRPSRSPRKERILRKQSLISLRLAPTPMRVFPIGIELANVVAVQRAHDADARELDRAATFSRARYQLRCCKDDRHAAFG
jgi:hypothetical protein